jgi:hypothetical protein
MKVYHGSYIKVDKIDLTKCRSNRDFGQGFYVTKFLHHAQNWSRIIGRRHHTQGVVSEFEYAESAFVRSICAIRQFDDYNGEWLDFVIMNRASNNLEPVHNYDIVEGPVADDKVQNRIEEFLKGKVTKADFLEELKYHETTHQICFCTLNSLQAINCGIGVGAHRYVVNIAESVIEKLMLDYNMDEGKATDILYTSPVFANLSDESTGLYQKPWQEIYEMLKKEIDKE